VTSKSESVGFSWDLTDLRAIFGSLSGDTHGTHSRRAWALHAPVPRILLAEQWIERFADRPGALTRVATKVGPGLSPDQPQLFEFVDR
jgi:hypothetical protein